MSAAPAPRTRWPANDALRVPLGAILTVRTKVGDTFTGRVTMRSDDEVHLTSDAGTLKIWTGAILSWHNHTPRQPRK